MLGGRSATGLARSVSNIDREPLPAITDGLPAGSRAAFTDVVRIGLQLTLKQVRSTPRRLSTARCPITRPLEPKRHLPPTRICPHAVVSLRRGWFSSLERLPRFRRAAVAPIRASRAARRGGREGASISR